MPIMLKAKFTYKHSNFFTIWTEISFLSSLFLVCFQSLCDFCLCQAFLKYTLLFLPEKKFFFHLIPCSNIPELCSYRVHLNLCAICYFNYFLCCCLLDFSLKWTKQIESGKLFVRSHIFICST